MQFIVRKHLFLALLTMFTLFCGSNSYAEEDYGSGQSCGVNNLCSKGLYCSGAVGEAESGICLQTGPYIVLCRLNQYLLDKVGKKFLLFGVIMVSVAFFLAKISWGMILSVVLGSGVMYGSTKLVKTISGRSSGFCTASQVMECFDVAEIVHFDSERVIRNLETEDSIDPDYPSCSPLECIKQKCKQSRIIAGKCVVTTQDETGYAAQGYRVCGTKACEVLNTSKEVDYFTCKNGCTDVTFSIDAPAGVYKDCSDYIRKKVSPR